MQIVGLERAYRMSFVEPSLTPANLVHKPLRLVVGFKG